MENLVFVEKGTFSMGNTRKDSKGESYENPTHTVKLTYDYWIGKYEITFEEYDAYTKAEGKSQASDYSSWVEYNMGLGTRPVIKVSWWDAIGYCNWLSKQEELQPAYDNDGKLLNTNGQITTDITEVEGYRLPTEAEWEYAARGGQKKTKDWKYAGSDEIKEVSWYWQNSGDKILTGTDSDWDEHKIKANNSKTHEVGTKKANELGIFDMSGNVWEWCHDWFTFYKSETTKTTTDPIGPDSDSRRVWRGGSWYNSAQYCRVASRSCCDPSYSRNFLGFRCVRTCCATSE